MEALLLGLSPQVLQSTSRENVTTQRVILLSDEFSSDLNHNGSLRHLYGRIFSLKADLEATILRGRYDGQGNDLTPHYRAALVVLNELVQEPARLELEAARVRDQLGLSAPPAFDSASIPAVP